MSITINDAELTTSAPLIRVAHLSAAAHSSFIPDSLPLEKNPTSSSHYSRKIFPAMDGSGTDEGKCIGDDWSTIFKMNPPPSMGFKCCPAPLPLASTENNRSFDGTIRASSPQALQLCTEGLGFESSDETESPKIQAFKKEGISVEEMEVETEQGTPRWHRAHCDKFPPPLPSIARNGNAGFFLKSCKKDGRFLLQEVKIPPHEVLRAWRGDGRLQLHLAHNDDFDDG